MAFGSEKLSYVIEIIKSGAEKDLKSLGNTADKELGKGGKAFASLKANASSFAIGAGAAIATFVVKAASGFTKLALDVEKFSQATGVSTDAASRWIEVAGDLGITTEQIQGGFVKLEKAIGSGSPAVEQLGITMQTAADGTADVSATMLQAIKALDGVKDPAMKAKLASDLFGRGFADMAELVTGDADAITKALGQVSDAKIIDQAEIAKAKKNRETIDELKDTFEDLSLVLGESALPAIEAVADGLKSMGTIAGAIKLDKVLDGIADLDEHAYKLGVTIRDVFDPDNSENFALVQAFEASEQAAQDFDRSLLEGLTTFDAVRAKVLELTDSEHAANLVALEWSKSTDEVAVAAERAGPSVQEMADKVEDARDAAGKLATQLPLTNAELRNMKEDADAAWKGIRDLKDQFALLRGELTDESAYLDLQDGFDAVQTAAEDAYIAAAEGAEDAEQKGRDYRQEILRQKERIIDFAEAVGTIPPETVAEILTQLDEGKLAEAEARIALLTANRTLSIIPVMGRLPAGTSPMGNGSVSRSPTGNMIAGATGGIVNRPTMALIGEAGPEAVIPLNRSRGNGPLPAGLGGSSINLTVNAGVNADGPEIARIIANKLREYQRFNGPGR